MAKKGGVTIPEAEVGKDGGLQIDRSSLSPFISNSDGKGKSKKKSGKKSKKGTATSKKSDGNPSFIGSFSDGMKVVGRKTDQITGMGITFISFGGGGIFALLMVTLLAYFYNAQSWDIALAYTLYTMIAGLVFVAISMFPIGGIVIWGLMVYRWNDAILEFLNISPNGYTYFIYILFHIAFFISIIVLFLAAQWGWGWWTKDAKESMRQDADGVSQGSVIMVSVILCTALVLVLLLNSIFAFW